MNKYMTRERALEISLVLVSLGLTCLLSRTAGYNIVVLNLFYLPVVLAALFLGRYRAGILALLSVIMASVALVIDFDHGVVHTSPLIIALAVTVWGAVLGLMALLVGTLSDEKNSQCRELHDAYHGIVEVLSRYLNSADPRRKDRAVRTAELSEKVARQMRLSDKQVDDVRIAALLQDLEHIEITARVIRRAVGSLEIGPGAASRQHTFSGSDLVQSLASVVSGALPLICSENGFDTAAPKQSSSNSIDAALSAQIIRAARAYDRIVHESVGPLSASNAQILEELRGDDELGCHASVIQALEQVVRNQPVRVSSPTISAEPSLAECT